MKVPVFGRISPIPLARFRAAFGLVILIHILHLGRDWLIFFGRRGLVTLDTVRSLHAHAGSVFGYVNLFAYLPDDDRSAIFLFWLLVISSIGLSVGLLTRLSNLLVLIGLTSIQMRNPYICNGADHLARLLAFYLLFSPAGEAISLDRLWRVWRTKTPEAPQLVLPWWQWMVQLQICVVYLSAGFEKLGQELWLDGSALYFVLRRQEFIRFDFFSHITLQASLIASWLTVAFELAVPVLIWFRATRLIAITCGLALHFGIGLAMKIPLFSWIMISSYLVFIPAGWLGFYDRMRPPLLEWLRRPLMAIFNLVVATPRPTTASPPRSRG